MKDKIVQSVLEKYQQRSEVGQAKYGVTLERNDLNFLQWLNHIQEELMDATLYIERLRLELEDSPTYPDGHIISKESWDNADKIIHDGFTYVRFTDLKFYK